MDISINKKQIITVVSIALLSLSHLVSADTDEIELGEKNVASKKIVIAHRGASGYLPEHTLAAKQLAYTMKADYLEQDLVLTKDDKLLVLHDIYLDNVTNVAAVYPNRARQDGHFYVIDFTLEEIKQLQVTERFRIKNNEKVAVFPERTPLWQGNYKVHTFSEELQLIAQLNAEHNTQVGIYTEIKSPSFFRHEGKDISRLVLQELKKFGYDNKKQPVYLQSFDATELKRIHDELLPQMQMQLKLVQLIAMTSWGITKEYHADKVTNYRYDWMLEKGAMSKIAQYADGIGPFKSMLVSKASSKGRVIATPMLKEAHGAGLVVHPYTFRADTGRVAKYANNFEDMLDIFLFQLGVDGVFTDFPDRAVSFLASKEQQPTQK